MLGAQKFDALRTVLQRDEYYDDQDMNLNSLDYVVRIRYENGSPTVGLKGPRFYAIRGEYSRVEMEFEAKDEQTLLRDLKYRGLQVTWFFEKRRTEYHKDGSSLSVAIDEIPEIGHFLEVEGPLGEVSEFLPLLIDALEPVPERRNYKELFVAHCTARGIAADTVKGASFGQTESLRKGAERDSPNVLTT
jgi:predicted adenylyl cyclase CyaB